MFAKMCKFSQKCANFRKNRQIFAKKSVNFRKNRHIFAKIGKFSQKKKKKSKFSQKSANVRKKICKFSQKFAKFRKNRHFDFRIFGIPAHKPIQKSKNFRIFAYATQTKSRKFRSSFRCHIGVWCGVWGYPLP